MDLHKLKIDNDKIETERLKQTKELDELQDNKIKVTKELSEIKDQFKKLNTLLTQKGYARKRREKTATTYNDLFYYSSSKRYRRRNEMKNVAEYIHGSAEGAIIGAWDFIINSGSDELIEKLIASHKRGKFLEKLQGKFSNVLDKSVNMKKAIATKYMTYLSRRKYELLCKIQKTAFESTEDNCIQNSVSYGPVNINLKNTNISHSSLDKFVKSLDIGQVHQIPGYAGVTRTVTALITMIVDVNLKISKMKENLIWFKNNINHFVVEFSDDGAPESSETTMTIGSLTLWNFGRQVRSREFHYPLHLISTTEKDVICENLWRQHTDEMTLIESNIFTINKEKVTFEFQPSADQAWQYWAANTLTQSASYPSPYANVHKSQLQIIGGSIGSTKEHTWQIPSMEQREIEIEKLKEFKSRQAPTSSEEGKHKQDLAFMAENGFRQIDKPRIGLFADRLHPEPLHLEINSWHHVLDLIYKEAVRRNKYAQFSKILRSPQKEGDKLGCGLKFIAAKIDEQYAKESDRYKKLEVRLIGSQAISLARYSYRLIDAIKTESCVGAQNVKLLALSKICQSLRDIGSQINRVNVNCNYPAEVEKLCKFYFNSFSLFFPESCNSTVWTLGYALPFHANKVYTDYGVGYGILSMQGKESKHSAIKQELKSGTNRAISQDGKGKWSQIMRSSFVRNFYLPYHFPVSSSYHSHYQSRKVVCDSENVCNCSRKALEDICQLCIDSKIITTCVELGELTDEIIQILKPIQCKVCNKRFPDFIECDNHVKYHHENRKETTSQKNIVPSKLNVNELKYYLKERNQSTTGTKAVLIRRLEGVLTTEI